MRTRAAHSASGKRLALTEDKSVKKCKGSKADATPVIQTCSLAEQSLEASPILRRKSVFLNARHQVSKNNRSAVPVSPILGRRKDGIGISVANPPRHLSKVGNSEKEHLHGKQLLGSHFTPLCDRKNILSFNSVQENAKKSGHSVFPVEMANLDKENNAGVPVRKSGRSKKPTEKYMNYIKKSSQVDESHLSFQPATTLNQKRCLRSTENIASGIPEKRNTKHINTTTKVVGHEQNSTSTVDNVKDADVQLKNKHESPDTNGINDLQSQDNDKDEYCEKTARQIIKKKSKCAAASEKQLKSLRTKDLGSLRATRTRVAAHNKGEPELGVESIPVKSTTASAEECLQASVASSELCSVTYLKNSKRKTEIRTEEENISLGTRSKAQANAKTFSAASKSCKNDSGVFCQPKTTRKASRTPRTFAKTTFKTVPASATKRSKTTIALSEKNPNEPRKESVQVSPSPTSLKKALSRKSSPKEPATEDSELLNGSETETVVCKNGNKLAVLKPPVWASERKAKSPRVGMRRSIRGKSDIFEFPVSPVKDNNKKKRRQYKPRVRPKALKPKPTLKTTLLITDPSWQYPTDISSRVRNIESANQESVRSASSERSTTGGENSGSIASEYNFDDDFDIHESEDFETCHQEDRICARGDENVLEQFPGETASSFVSPQNTASSEPMVSASAMPTPAIVKHVSKYLGSSTPRVENSTFTTSAKEPVALKDDIAQCFGFEDSNDSTTDEDTVSGISPVRQPGLSSHFNFSYASDLTDNINQTSTQPYRFSWGSLRAGQRSHASSCSSSMVAQGRSVNSSMQSSVSSFSQNFHLTGNMSKKISTNESVARRDKQRVQKPVKNSESRSNHDVSVLFDEEPVDVGSSSNTAQESQNMCSLNTLDQYLAQNSGYPSPDKSFQQPARRSYDKRALEEARKKFIRGCGGIVTTEAETEEDISVQKEPVKRKKTNNRKKAAKKKKPVEDSTTDVSQSTDDSTAMGAPDKKKHKAVKKKKKEDVLEKSMSDWASDLNTHFSEVEDFEMVVM